VDSTALIATALLALVLAALSLTLRRHVRLYILAFVAIPQFYLPGVPVPLAQAYALFLLVASFFDTDLRIRKRAITVPIGILATLTLVALIFPPHPGSAMSILVYYGTWVCILRYIWAERSSPRHLNIAIASTIPWIVLEAVLTVSFRLRPSLENAFLHSPVAELLIGPAAPSLFSGEPNNVLDPAKAGGLFVNGNVASMFLGVACLTIAVLARRLRSRLLGVLSIATLAAVFATGSKTGAVLAILIPIVAWVIVRVSRGSRRVFILPALLAVVGASIAAPAAISTLFPSFTAQGDVSLGTRGGLWGLAGRLFVDHPFAGVGWDEFQEYALRLTGSAFPPHNLIIAAWANTGILGGITVVGFIVGCVVGGLVAAFRATDQRQRRIIVYALCGSGWVFIHGMADNTSIYGEPKTMVLLSLLLALSLPAAARLGTDRVSAPAEVVSAVQAK